MLKIKADNLTNHPFTTVILNWYAQNKRSLPWREQRNPYLIWLSEIILQQTRIAQGLPYYQRFVRAYPDVHRLAAASADEVLRLWQGLGYYSRARNLHKCAQIVAVQHHGHFPDNMAALRTLPGIGPYTAAAIASLAFNEAVPAIDGNVYRVLARYFGDETDITSAGAFKHFYQLSLAVLDKGRPGDYNQALMDFGALFCTPRQPDCRQCVLQSGCVAFATNRQQVLPVKSKKAKIRERNFYYVFMLYKDKVLMRQRPAGDIWQGLYEPVLIEHDRSQAFGQLQHPLLDMLHQQGLKITWQEKNIRHLLSHQLLNVNFALVSLGGQETLATRMATGAYHWYALSAVEALPKPVLIANYLDTRVNSINLQ